LRVPSTYAVRDDENQGPMSRGAKRGFARDSPESGQGREWGEQ